MLHTRLPNRNEAWDCSIFIEPAPVIHGVSGRGGLVIACGADLFMLRPGAEQMLYRESFLDDGEMVVAAVEARSPWRYAVASNTMVAAFFKHEGEDSIVKLSATDEIPATHLAWGRSGDATVLWIRWADGVVVRTTPDMTSVEVLDLGGIDALASDADGNVALASLSSFDDGRCRVYRARGSSRLAFHDFDPDLPHPQPHPPSGHPMHLAIAGDAVAVSTDRGGVWLSRSQDDPFVKCDHLRTAGPVEFDGPTSDANLFGVVVEESMGAIVRVEEDGGALRIAEFGHTKGGPLPRIAAISWDSTRQRLWVASPEMGLFTCTDPTAKKSVS